jgi:hypothetical protein
MTSVRIENTLKTLTGDVKAHEDGTSWLISLPLNSYGIQETVTVRLGYENKVSLTFHYGGSILQANGPFTPSAEFGTVFRAKKINDTDYMGTLFVDGLFYNKGTMRRAETGRLEITVPLFEPEDINVVLKPLLRWMAYLLSLSIGPRKRYPERA